MHFLSHSKRGRPRDARAAKFVRLLFVAVAGFAATTLIAGGPRAAFAVGAGEASLFGQALLPGRGGAAGGAVAYLEDGPAGAQNASGAKRAVVDQRQKAFVPHVSVVMKGTTVRFPNSDTVFHNVFAYYQAKKFDLGMYPRGASKSVTFDKAGVVVLQCNVHSEMSAYILVVDTPLFAVADKNGRFRLPPAPPGAYTLHVWHESGARTQQSVRIGGSAAAASAPLTVTLTRR